MHLISVLLGLVFAWAILFFIGPKPRLVSYYEPEAEKPVVGMAMSELDAMMMAVGLLSEAPEPEPEFSLSPAPAPAPVLSVADMAMSPAPSLMMNMSMPPATAVSQSVADLDDQDTAAIPLFYAPSPRNELPNILNQF